MLQLLARGLTNQEIGGILQISGETVRTHVSAVLYRLEVSNRTEAAALYRAFSVSTDRVSQILACPAIAVLPVIVLDQDTSAATIAAGLTRDLVALFSRWCCFPVIANVSTQDSRSRGGTSQEIGASLGARFLVDGALRTAGTHFRITATIVDALNGSCVWAEAHDFPRDALFEMQDAVCHAIVAAAYPQLISTVQRTLLRGPRPADLQAWELAQEALLLQAAREREENQRAQEGFSAALSREPTLILAHFGLGLASYDELLNQWGPKQPALDRLASCAESCINLGPHMAEGYFLAARHRQALARQLDAIGPLKQAISNNPSFAAAHALLGQVLLMAGQNEEGLQRTKHACRLGPRAFVAGLAAAHFLRGEYAEALTFAEDALDRNPRYPFALMLAAASAWWADDPERAARHCQSLFSVHPSFSAQDFMRGFGPDIAAISRITQALDAMSRTRRTFGPA